VSAVSQDNTLFKNHQKYLIFNFTKKKFEFLGQKIDNLESRFLLILGLKIQMWLVKWDFFVIFKHCVVIINSKNRFLHKIRLFVCYYGTKIVDIFDPISPHKIGYLFTTHWQKSLTFWAPIFQIFMGFQETKNEWNDV